MVEPGDKAAVASVAAVGGGGGGGSSARSARRREDIQKILRLRDRRRRLMLLSCGEGGVEPYTDKTRNAAVVMGEKDIKLSLSQQRRALAAARGFSLPACAQPSGLTALARAHRRAGQTRAALQLTEQVVPGVYIVWFECPVGTAVAIFLHAQYFDRNGESLL